MTKWLESILAEIKAVTDAQAECAEPESESCEHEYIVGKLDSDLRKTFFIFKQYLRRSLEIKAALTVCGKSEREQLEADFRRFDTNADALKEIFWTSCKTTFPELWAKPVIGLRKNWELVWFEPKYDGPPLETLGELISRHFFEEMFEPESSETSVDKSRLN